MTERSHVGGDPSAAGTVRLDLERNLNDFMRQLKLVMQDIQYTIGSAGVRVSVRAAHFDYALLGGGNGLDEAKPALAVVSLRVP